MSERFLRSVSIQVGAGDALLPSNEQTSIKDLEIWTSRSKVVNQQIHAIDGDLEFVSLVDLSLTPVWAILDKPYNVYTSNQQSLAAFEKLTNYSSLKGDLVQNAILAKISKGCFLVFYVEKTNGQFMVNCLLLEINFGRFKQILANATDNNLDTDSTFIDEVIEKKDDLIDTILKQRSVNFSNLNSKRQAELSIKQQQLQRSQIRQQFKKVITVNVKNRMSHKPKPLQNEVAEICFKGMCHKFNDVLTTNDEVFEELQKWLDLFLDILGE